MSSNTVSNTRYLLQRVGATKWGVFDQETKRLARFHAGGRRRLYTVHVSLACEGANSLNGREVYNT